MTDNMLKAKAFKLKGRFFTFTVVQILDSDKDLFTSHLQEVVAQAPRLFNDAPVVLDCSGITLDDLALESCCEVLRQQRLIPIAVLSGEPQLEALAKSYGLAVINSSSAPDRPIIEQQDNITQNTQEFSKTKTLTTPVRSGQQVVSKNGDLVITSSVSHGAELLADGNIHVYGALRGRALAGIAGDTTARIFCRSLDAELVSIAGFYQLRDTMPPIAHPCQIYLKDERIQIEEL